MTTRSASSRSVTPVTPNKRSTSKDKSKPLTITAAEFDRLADLPVDDPAGDLEPFIDHDKTRRPGREVQRVNVDFPVDLLRAIDHEATRIGVTRQAFIKLRLADGLTSASKIAHDQRQPTPARSVRAKLAERIRNRRASQAPEARAKKKHS